MRKFYLLASLCAMLALAAPQARAQVTCNPNGNLWVYANYDGGVLNINVDQNIPNIKIGICTYEPTTINITGAFVGNVTEVRYAGYVSTNNNHCPNSPSTTTITGVAPGITSVNFLPPSTLSNPNGYSSIVCAYSCSTTSNQGGCNTADQIKHYFETSMNASLVSYYTQYGCWSTQPYLLSSGGNCCSMVLPCNLVANAGQDAQICPNGSTQLVGSATGGATTYTWSPATGLGNPNSASTTASPSVTTTYVLTATDGGVCADQDTVVVTVLQPQVSLSSLPTQCTNGTALTLTNGSPSGGTYSGAGVSSGSFDPAAAGVGQHELIYSATDGNGCLGADTVLVTVVAPAAVTIDFIDPFCIDGAAAAPVIVGPSGGIVSGTGIINGEFFPAVAGVGSHTVTYAVTDGNGCNATATTTVVVNAQPAAPVLTFAAPNLFTASSGDSIQWFLNGSYLLTNGNSIVPSQNGLYTAVVWVGGCPSDTSAGVTVELVGVANAGGIQVVAWPNPAGDRLHVAMSGTHFRASLQDALGRVVIPAADVQGEALLSLHGLPSGVYFLTVAAEGGSASLRILHVHEAE